jgi:hypothetical protein
LILEVLKRVTTPNSRCDTGMFRGCAAHITAQVEHGASAVTAAKPLAECVTCGDGTLPGPCAWLCFEDEAGQGLRPPRGRTWGRRGRTPVVRVTSKGGHRVSIAGLIATRPGRPPRLLYRMRLYHRRAGESKGLTEADYAALFDGAHQLLGGPLGIAQN